MNKKDNQNSLSYGDQALDQSFWESKWQSRQTGWDIGYASPAIATYMEEYPNKDAAILIPGCGNAHEAEFLISQGFSNITLLDIAPKAVEIVRKKFAKVPQVKILQEDFFQHQGKYELIIEQSFFCAIPSSKREDYAEKAFSLLKEGGKIVGLLFDRYFDHQGPPFGGSVAEYIKIFQDHFEIEKMQQAYNSIPARAGSEVFIKLLKK